MSENIKEQIERCEIIIKNATNIYKNILSNVEQAMYDGHSPLQKGVPLDQLLIFKKIIQINEEKLSELIDEQISDE